MTPEALRHYRDLLEKMRDALIEEGYLDFQPANDGVNAPDEDGQPLSEMLQAIASRRNSVRTNSIKQINAALTRLIKNPDDFGYCAECDEPLPQQRLELMPQTEFCMECQAQRESPRGARRRHLTDYE